MKKLKTYTSQTKKNEIIVLNMIHYMTRGICSSMIYVHIIEHIHMYDILHI